MCSDSSSSPKMETNRQSNLKADTSEKDTQQSKKRKQPTNGYSDVDTNNTNNIDNTVNLSESTTVDDISTMDVSTYLAWVNRQAKSLPNVFVATPQADNTVDHTKEQQTTAAKETSTAKVSERQPFTG